MLDSNGWMALLLLFIKIKFQMMSMSCINIVLICTKMDHGQWIGVTIGILLYAEFQSHVVILGISKILSA